MIALLGVLACAPRGDAAAGLPDTAGSDPPQITAVTWACDVDAATWTFQVDTDAWSAGAYLWMATDPATWERHSLYSQGAAADGSADRLGVELSIVADWRDAAPGSSTRFLCSEEDELAFQVTVYTRDGTEATDCARWGVEGVLEGMGEVPGCGQGL